MVCSIHQSKHKKENKKKIFAPLTASKEKKKIYTNVFVLLLFILGVSVLVYHPNCVLCVFILILFFSKRIDTIHVRFYIYDIGTIHHCILRLSQMPVHFYSIRTVKYSKRRNIFKFYRRSCMYDG